MPRLNERSSLLSFGKTKGGARLLGRLAEALVILVSLWRSSTVPLVIWLYASTRLGMAYITSSFS